MRLALGTAQFGSAYGITNTRGGPSESDIKEILDTFFSAGNSFIDTAQGYGSAHQAISKWRRTRNDLLDDDIHIITKLYIKNKEDITLFSSNVVNICQELGVKSLYGILIHNPSDLNDQESWSSLNQQFKDLKLQGIVKKTGVSVYDPSEVVSLYNNSHEINLIQCPANILDQRFLGDTIQDFCGQNNIEIHGRSLFLQGVLLSDKVPEALKDKSTLDVLKNYQRFLKSKNLTALEACYQFAYQNQSKINRWVVGFNQLDELGEFLSQVKKNEKSSDTILFDELRDGNSYVDPRTWRYIKSC